MFIINLPQIENINNKNKYYICNKKQSKYLKNNGFEPIYINAKGSKYYFIKNAILTNFLTADGGEK